MNIINICIIGILLDQLIGDPVWLYHPVRMIGNFISFVESKIRPAAKEKPEELLKSGAMLWAIVLGVSVVLPMVILLVLDRMNPKLSFLLSCFWCFQLLAAKSLKVESMKVHRELKKHDLEGARKAVSMIVGRDTSVLDETGVTKAAVETVAENTSDGVIAPLFYMLIGGPILGFAYKAINTMDSMIGYKNDKYLYFGRFAAKMDDVANFIPARISGLLMILSARILGFDWKNAWKIYRRDRKKHASPNAAQTEAVCAGALDVQLAGNAVYFGKVYEKEYIGDPIREIEPDDIKRAGQLMDTTEVLTFGIFAIIRWVLIVLLCQ